MDFLYQIFGFLLLQLYNLIGNYGVSIIVFTIIVKLLLLPLNIKQTKSMKDMQRLQPELQKLNKKYKNNQEKLNEETLKLYKVYKVNPAAGCLPLLLQFPILIGLYGTLRYPETWVFSSGMDYNSAFLTISDLNGMLIDNLDEPSYYVLPILAAVFTFLTQKFTMANSSMNPDDPNAKMQKVMLYMMPIMIGYISIKMPAGVALYWVVQNVFTFFQQFIMMRIPEPEISIEEAERRVQEADKERKADLAARRSGMSQTDNQKEKPERKEPLTKPATKKKIKSNQNENRKKPVSEIPERDENKE